MFREPISEITFENIEDFCKQALPEGIRLDYKENFPKDLAKTIAAFANMYGGVILIGVEETDESTPKLPIKGIPSERGLHEKVTTIALSGIYPPVFPEVKVCEFRSKGSKKPRAVILIRVQESPDAPHAIENKTKVYFRVDRQTQPYELADIDQVEAMLNSRRRAEENRERMIEGAYERCQNICTDTMGFSIISTPSLPKVEKKATRTVIITPVFPHGSLASLDEIYKFTQQHSPPRELRMTGTFIPIQGGIMSRPLERGKAVEFNYMQISQQGLVFYLENLWEDTWMKDNNEHLPLHIEITVRVIAKVIEYALRCYEKLGFWGTVEIRFILSRILGRKLAYGDPPRFVRGRYVCYDKGIKIFNRKSVSELREDHLTVVKGFLKEFMWAFGFKARPEDIQACMKHALPVRGRG